MWCFRVLAILSVVMSGIEPTAAQAPVCASILAVAGPMGYQHRPNADRCEGLYQQEVVGSLEFLSLVTGPISYNLEIDRTLVVSVPRLSQFPNAQIFLGARALRPGTHYRMDAAVGSTGTFKWPLDAVIRPMGLSSDTVGVVAWLNADLGKYYIPVSVAAENATASTEPRFPVMLLRSSLDIETLNWRWWPEGGGARPSNWMKVGDITQSPIRAGQLTKIAFKDQSSGTIIVQIAPRYTVLDQIQLMQIRIIMP